jgi:Flp pilus assembly protein TadG
MSTVSNVREGAHAGTLKAAQSAARSLAKRLLTNEDGGPLIEFAMVFPMLVAIMTGIFYLGIGMAEYIQLTNATDIAAREISISRGVAAQAADPCNTGTTYFEAAAPNLAPSSLTFVYTINGSSHTGTSCTSLALSSSSQGENVEVQVTYPIHLGIYNQGWSTIQLKSQTTEIIQ